MKKKKKNLKQVGGHAGRAVAVVEGQGRAEGRGGHADEHRLAHRHAPRVLRLRHGVAKEIVEQQVGQVVVLLKRGLDVAQEHAA
mgnify:CR=1 FL=1